MRNRRASSPRPLLAAIVVACFAGAPPAAAQTPAPITQPIGRFVADVHGVLGKYDQPNHVAAQLGVAKADLPTVGLGFGGGVHVYPFRWHNVTFGVGVSTVWTRGLRTPRDTTGKATGPTVETKLRALAPQASLNFGTRDGWSYISVGTGPATYTVRLAASPEPTSVPRVRALNFGAGARWFAKRHFAFSFDLRWYALPPQRATGGTPEVFRTTRMVLGAGVSIK